MNRRLIAAVRAFQPDAIVILKGETISWESLRNAAKPENTSYLLVG